MISLVPGLGSRKFATQVVYLSLASLGLVAAKFAASFTFYVRNPNPKICPKNFSLVRFKNFSKIFFENFFPKFFRYFFQKIFAKIFFQNCDTRLLQWYLWSLALSNSRLRVPGLGSRFKLSICVTLTLCVYSKIFFKIFFQKFFRYFCPFQKLRHTASLWAWLSLASFKSRLGALAPPPPPAGRRTLFQEPDAPPPPLACRALRFSRAGRRPAAPDCARFFSRTPPPPVTRRTRRRVFSNIFFKNFFLSNFYVRNQKPFQKFIPKFFFKIFFQNFSDIFFKIFFQNFFPKLRHTAPTMVSLVPGLGSRNFFAKVVTCPLRLWASKPQIRGYMLLVTLRNPNLCGQKFFQKAQIFLQNFEKFFRKFFEICANIFFLTLCVFSKIFFKNFFPKFFPYFFQKFLPKFFPKLRHTASTMVSLVPGLGSRKFATQVVYLSLASLGLVAANSRLHASLTFYVPNPNLVRFFQNFFSKIFSKIFPIFFSKFSKIFCHNFFQNLAKIFSKIATHGFYNGIFGPWAW